MRTGSSSNFGLGKRTWNVSKEVTLRSLKKLNGFNKGKNANKTAKGIRAFLPN